MSKKPKPDDPEQMKRFMEAAKEAEASDSASAMNEAFNKVGLKPRAPKDN